MSLNNSRSAVNIGARECRKRLVPGIITLVIGVVVAATLILTGVNCWWRIGLFLPFWMGALGYFQAREKT
jgi:hypothetical protein